MVSTTGARAQQRSSPLVHFGASGGVSIPLGDLSKNSQTGYLVGGFFEGAPSGSPVGLRGEVSYSGYTVKTGGFTSSILGFIGNAVIYFDAPSSGLYLIGGAGIYHFNNTAGITSTKFGVNGGGGFRWPLGGASSFVEARYHYVSTSGTILSPDGSTTNRGSTTFIPIVFGVVF
jgi:hypothetical protein